jgi:photosystem II stability/assembly factor-like uncharacterized protein
MADNYGTGVSFVDQVTGYNYDTVVFQKGKPPLDTELNAVQQIRNLLDQREHSTLPSGWLTLKPFYTSSLLSNSFYTQDPSAPTPEYALVNGDVLHITNTATTISNTNLVELGAPPPTGNQVNGIFLEVWRALLSPVTSTNRPVPETIISALKDISVIDKNTAWAVGENGLILATPDAGQTWAIQLIDSKNTLNGVFFVTSTIGWLVGTNGCIARTTSGGQRWNVLATGFNQDLNSIYAASQLNAWAVGNSGVILNTSNAVTWLAQTSGVSVDLNSVYFSTLNPLIGWVVGKNGTILRTTDGGANWIKVASGTTIDLNSVFFYNLNEGFAVGNAGTILKSTDGGRTWIGLSSGVTVDLTDVAMTPSLDQQVVGEEVTSQFTGSNKNFVTMNAPITVGDGKGTITNVPADVIVTVNGVQVGVDVVVGATGQIVLALPPRACDTVKVTYYYRITNNVFRGNAYVSGKTGTVLYSGDVGATWVPQSSGVFYDLNAVAFADLKDGWLVGLSSIIRHTMDSGTTWLPQSSNIPYRQIQRVFLEGNILVGGGSGYLPDDSIHPDVNIETTERVQIQYAIRTVNNVDPLNFPDSGLGSQVVLSIGPNASGTFAYENMGSINGDYGLWRAKCANTVDGYCYAIPMFFVNRRNASDYNPSSNSNGTTNYTTDAIRLDLLSASNVVDSDILDVRRMIQVPAVAELLDASFEQLMDGRLKTRMALDTVGGDKFGTEIFQLDRVGPGSFGSLIPNALFKDAVDGNISSQVSLSPVTYPILVPASRPVPPTQTFTDSSGVFHPNSMYYSAVYQDTTRPIPGFFEGFGTKQLTFTFDSSANTQAEDPGLSGLNYFINTTQVNVSSLALTHVPSKPGLVKNTRTGSIDFYYQGVFDSETSGRVIEQWPSDAGAGYINYAVVYPGSDVATPETKTMASTVELHYFIKTDSSNVLGTDTLVLSSILAPPDASTAYNILSVSKLNNVTAGYSYKIKDIVFPTITTINLQTAPGFPFITGTVFEVVGQCLSSVINGYKNRNGASVNFTQSEKKIGTFCSSVLLTDTNRDIHNTITLTLPNNDTIIGVSSTDSTGAVGSILPFCWAAPVAGSSYGSIHPIKILSDFTNNSIVFNIIDNASITTSPTSVTVQVLTRQNNLPYSVENSTDSLQIGYSYIPYQSISELPTTLTAQIALKPTVVNVSTLGTGGSVFTREPYQQPLINIPVNDPLIPDDNSFYNIEPLRFANFSIDGGFAQLPAYVPGNLNGSLVLSEPTKDNQSRYYYGISSREFNFRTEGLLTPAARKVFAGLLGRVLTSSDNKLLRGEYVLIIVSKNESLSLENSAGFTANANSVIAIYRLPNRPIVRI